MPRTEDFNRDEVLHKAQHAFWLKGFNGTSMQDLVDATGLNRSSIYNSFGSKMELYRESLKKYQKESSGLFEKAASKDRSALETIGLLFLYTLDDMQKDKEGKGCMLINCATEMSNQDVELRKLLQANQTSMVSHFEELVIRGQEEGSIRRDEKSSALAHYLTSSFQGFRITGMNTSETAVLKSIIQNILKTIV